MGDTGFKSRKLADGTKSYRGVFAWEGRTVTETFGRDKYEARRRYNRLKRQLAEGSFVPSDKQTEKTIAGYGIPWFEKRTTRNAQDDLKVLVRLVFSRDWFAKLPLREWRVPHTLRLIKELLATPMDERARRCRRAPPGTLLGEKYVSNIFMLLHSMVRMAKVEELIDRDPCELPPGTFSSAPKQQDTFYEADAVVRMVHTEKKAEDGTIVLSPEERLLGALVFYTGMRKGEVCARRWKDYDAGSKPGCLHCNSQYDDQPLKTERRKGERSRKIPVHDELAASLKDWWETGWEFTFLRKPTPEDRILPSFSIGRGRKGATEREHVLGTHTKSTIYKMWRRACEHSAVENKSLHATRHTFITHTRRGGAMPDHLEKATHNRKGETIDQYTHLGWAPVADAVAHLHYLPKAPEPGPSTAAAALTVPAALAEKFQRLGIAKGIAITQAFDIIVEALGIEPDVLQRVLEKSKASNERCQPSIPAENGGTRQGTDSEATARSPDAVTSALADAAARAAAAGEWSVVSQLAGELETRRRKTAGNVVTLTPRKRGGA